MATVELSTLNPSHDEFETLQRQCRMAVISGLLPDVYRQGTDNERLAKAVTVAIKGRELGVPMMAAFSEIHIVKGRPTISATLMRALINRDYPTAEIIFERMDSEGCIIHAKRPNEKKLQVFSFLKADAERAQLLGPKTLPDSPWRKYPTDMFLARATSKMARAKFPECLMGCLYTPEELGGEIVDVDPVEAVPTNQVTEAVHNPPEIDLNAQIETIDDKLGTLTELDPNLLETKIIGFGKFKGLQYHEIKTPQLENYLNNFCLKQEKPGWGLKDFITEASVILTNREKQKIG